MTVPALRVLLADDSRDVRELYEAALRARGLEVVALAADGTEAVALAARHQPDLALVDLGMPVLGGLEALPALATASPRTRTIVVSGFPRDDLHALTVANGAVGYVEKGLSVWRLVDDVLAVAGVLESAERALTESRTRLERDLASGAAARRFLEETLDGWTRADVLDIAKLLVSELVTNAVLHAESEPDVTVILRSSTIRVEVGDRAGGSPSPHRATPADTSGRGLAIVQAMASAWGVEPRREGKVVWFELPRPEPKRG